MCLVEFVGYFKEKVHHGVSMRYWIGHVLDIYTYFGTTSLAHKEKDFPELVKEKADAAEN